MRWERHKSGKGKNPSRDPMDHHASESVPMSE